MAYMLRTSLWAYAVFTVFSYVAYSAWLPLIAGVTVGFFAAAQPELALADVSWLKAARRPWRRSGRDAGGDSTR